VFRSDETIVSQPSQTHVDSIGDLGSVDRNGKADSDSEGELMYGKAKRVGVSRKAARVGVGEQRSESGTGDRRSLFGGCISSTCCVCCCCWMMDVE